MKSVWGKRMAALFLATAVGAFCAGCGSTSESGASANEAETSDSVETSDNTESAVTADDSSKYFIKGADISSLEAVEDYGGTFYDFDGNEVDALTYLTENGCNYYRLRIWNNPTMSFDTGDYCDLEHTLTMAKRIKDAGADFLLDFHYSDWWADPDNQSIPSEWADYTEEELIQAVYDYTADVLTQLAEEDAYPDMVQIGNEIGNGMLWDYGTTDHPETLAALLNSGIQAVRDTTPDGQETQIMIHVQTGAAVSATEEFFQLIEDNGVTDYDVVGLSYYPYWQGSVADMKANVDNIYEKFGKQVVLAETAYSFTNDNADDKDNMVSEEDLTDVGFEASEENQKLVLELIMNSVAECEGGLGIFYWEPAWIPVEGAGVSKGSGNEWENEALFDFEGNALDAITAFAFEPGSLDNDQALYVYPFDTIEVDESATGDTLKAELPETAQVLYMDGSVRDVEVNWDLDSKKSISDTRCSFSGTVLDYDVTVAAKLTDTTGLNNLDFEDGDTGWTIDTTGDAGKICSDDTSYPHSGDWSFQYWSADAFTIDLYQQVTIDESAQYNLQVWSQGIGESDLKLTLYIADTEGNILASTEFTDAGWDEWQHPCVSADLEAGDTVRIGVLIDGTSDDWGTLDEFTFYSGDVVEDTQAADTSDAGATGSDSDAGDATVADRDEAADGTTAGTANLLQNPSLENGESGWTITKDGTGSGTIRNDSEGYPHSGDYSFHYWNDSDFTIDLCQTVNIEETGTYTLSGFSQGDADSGTSAILYVKDESGAIIASTDFSNKGWDMWQNPVVEGIELEGGQTVTVGVFITGKANGWGTMDDFSLCKN